MKATLTCAAILLFTSMLSCTQESLNGKKKELDITLTSPAVSDENKDADQQIPIGITNLVAQAAARPGIKPAPQLNWEKKIIKTAAVKLEVKKFAKYNDLLRQKIQLYGGYIAGEDNFFTVEKSEMVVSIKVPVENFESLMNDLAGNDAKIIDRSIKTEDVTTQVIDIKSRLEAKKQMRLKYLEFLNQSKNMTEVLQVQNEINSIQEEIEAAAGRIQYLANQSAYSTIKLTFYEPLPGFEPTNITPSFFTKAADGFRTGTNFIKELVLAMINVWPLLIIGLTGLYLWKRNKTSRIVTTNR